MKRRDLLRFGMAAGCSVAAHPLWAPISMAAVPSDARMVVIILRGAMDGLDVFAPYGDRSYRDLRPGLARHPDGKGDRGCHDLNGYFGLHPEMGELLPLWQAGELAFAPAVSTPYRDARSHFDGQDLLEAGTGGDVHPGLRRSGWLNRMVAQLPDSSVETAYSVGVEDLAILNGYAPSLSWSPGLDFNISAQARHLLQAIYAHDPLFRDAAAQADAISASASALTREKGAAGDAVMLAEFAAARLRGQTRVVAFSLAGFDTHARQAQAIRTPLQKLQAALVTLKTGLGTDWRDTIVFAMTEFGRTAHQNGTGGTDHGTGGALILSGGLLSKAGVFSDWPGLAEGQLYAGRDLMPVRDVRAYPGWAMHKLYGLSAETITRDVFPGLDLGRDPGFLA